MTAIFPYVVLVIFFIRACTLKGMGDGVKHLFTPKFELLLDPQTWLEAGTQIFFSLGLSFGSLIAYSSYNPVTNDCVSVAFIVAFTNCCTSVFAAIIIFGIMGFKAHTVHDACVEENERLVNSSSVNGDGWVSVNQYIVGLGDYYKLTFLSDKRYNLVALVQSYCPIRPITML